MSKRQKRSGGYVATEIANGVVIERGNPLSAYHVLIIGDSKDGIAKTAKKLWKGSESWLNLDLVGAQSVGKNQSMEAIIVDKTASRHNISSRPDLLLGNVVTPQVKKSTTVGVCFGEGVSKECIDIWTLVVFRAFPCYSAKTGQLDSSSRTLQKVILDVSKSKQDVCIVGDSIRAAQALVDMPPSHLTSQVYEDFVRESLAPYPVTIDVITGTALLKKGMGGIWGVGKGAEFSEGRAPRMIVCKYTPKKSGAYKTLVGKGIIFDTGGLAIKGREGMCGMKRDMGGSAGLFGAFLACVKNKVKDNLALVLCIAENSVSAPAFRQDDILEMYSGKSVEINNTDAEGRLVLGDGVHYASYDLNSSLILDMATLTGAQGVATGQNHGAIMTDTAEYEISMIKAGRASGDMVFPIPFMPEIYMDEFKSSVADMKNSVKNRSNAQCSCAGTFIYSHLHRNYKGAYVHVDMAYPVHVGERATGYGVALVSKLLKGW